MKPGKKIQILLLWGLVLAILQSCSGLPGNGIRLHKLKTNLFGYSGWDSLAGGVGPLRACYDALFYDLEVKIDPETRSIYGGAVMRFKAVEDFTRMQVDLHHKLDLLYVELDGKKVHFSRKKDIIYLKTGHFPKGRTGELSMLYKGKPEVSNDPPWKGGFVWSRDTQGSPWIGAVCENEGASLWWPNKAHPSDEPDSMRVTLIVPDSLTAVSNGRLVSDPQPDEKGYLAWEWKISNPINTDNVSLYIGNYSHFLDTLKQNRTQAFVIENYVLENDVKAARRHFQQLHRIIKFMEDKFGPYPFPEDGFKVIHAPYVGMEHQSAIAYGNGFDNDNNYETYGLFDYILLHETAHQWWGNSLTACDVAETWLHEGFSTYSEVLFIETFLGKPHAQGYLDNLKMGIQNQYPLVGPRGVNFHGPKNSDIYSKGAWVLHSLRWAIGDDEVFNSLLKEWAKRYSKSIVCTQDFIRLANELSGKDWTPFFTQFVYREQLPTLEYWMDGKFLYLRWMDVPPGLEMPLRVVGDEYGMVVSVSESISMENWAQTGFQPDEDFVLYNLVSNPVLPLLMELE